MMKAGLIRNLTCGKERQLLLILKFTKYLRENSFTVNTEFDIVYEH